MDVLKVARQVAIKVERFWDCRECYRPVSIHGNKIQPIDRIKGGVRWKSIRRFSKGERAFNAFKLWKSPRC